MTTYNESDSHVAIAAGVACLRVLMARAVERGMNAAEVAQLVLTASITMLAKTFVAMELDDDEAARLASLLMRDMLPSSMAAVRTDNATAGHVVAQGSA